MAASGTASRKGAGGAGRIERRLVRRHARTTAGRMKLAAAFRAVAVLARRHPGAMADMVASGAVAAARTGVQELSARLRRWKGPGDSGQEVEAAGRRPLSGREWKRFRRLLDRGRG